MRNHKLIMFVLQVTLVIVLGSNSTGASTFQPSTFVPSARALMTTPSRWSAEGDQHEAYFGRSVDTAGDVNGDGYDDVIIGAYYYDNGESNEGQAFVYHGSIEGLSSTPDWIAEGNQDYAHFGQSVSAAGDVNGDGYDDVIVGAPSYQNDQDNDGRAFVYHGSANGLSTTPDWIGESNKGIAEFGYSVNAAGDVNGDGYDDVIIGETHYGLFGAVFVYHGSPTGLSETANWVIEGDKGDNFSFFASSVSTAGDVNGDGYDDVIVGEEYFTGGQDDEGRAFVYHGSATGLSTTPNWTAEGDQEYANFGNSVSAAGDVNGDGYDDVIIGAYYYDNGESNEGQAFVYHGSATGLDNTPNWIGQSDQEKAYFGKAVGNAGDVNDDGYADIIIGAHLYDNPEPGEGQAFVYHGSATGLSISPDWTGPGSDQPVSRLGYSVYTAGDVNGDGFRDVIVGVPFYDIGVMDEVGLVFVYHGSADGLSSRVVEQCQQYDFGDPDVEVPITLLGWSWDFTASGNLHVDKVEASTVLAAPEHPIEFHVEVKINENIIASWDPYWAYTWSGFENNSASTSVDVYEGDTVTFFIQGDYWSSIYPGVVTGPNYVRLCGNEAISLGYRVYLPLVLRNS